MNWLKLQRKSTVSTQKPSGKTYVDVLELAQYVLYRFEKEHPLSNFELQSVLWTLWIRYFRATKTRLFLESFQAEQWGVSVPSVYREYCVYGASPIIMLSNNKIPVFPRKVRCVIDPILDSIHFDDTFDFWGLEKSPLWNEYAKRQNKEIPWHCIAQNCCGEEMYFNGRVWTTKHKYKKY